MFGRTLRFFKLYNYGVIDIIIQVNLKQLYGGILVCARSAYPNVDGIISEILLPVVA